MTETHGLGIESHYPKMIGSIQPATCLVRFSAPVSFAVATLLVLILSKQGEMTQVNSVLNLRLTRRRLILKHLLNRTTAHLSATSQPNPSNLKFPHTLLCPLFPLCTLCFASSALGSVPNTRFASADGYRLNKELELLTHPVLQFPAALGARGFSHPPSDRSASCR